MVVRQCKTCVSWHPQNPYAEEKIHVLLVYNAPMAFQIHFCLTIKTHQLTNLQTQKLINLEAHQLTNLSTHQLRNSKPQNLKP